MRCECGGGVGDARQQAPGVRSVLPGPVGAVVHSVKDRAMKWMLNLAENDSYRRLWIKTLHIFILFYKTELWEFFT